MQKYNKLIVSLLGAGATALTLLTGIPVPVEAVQMVGGLITSMLVYAVPNKGG